MTCMLKGLKLAESFVRQLTAQKSSILWLVSMISDLFLVFDVPEGVRNVQDRVRKNFVITRTQAWKH